MKESAEKAPRLTIVIPTVNRASLVTRAIDSALAQTYPDIEIIVSNNGSTDDTRKVLDRYEGAPRLRIIHLEKTIPVNPHGNFLFDQAKGEFFLGLSDDDWLEPQFAERVVEVFDRHAGVAFVWTGCWIHYADVAVPANTGPELESGAEFIAGFFSNRRNVCWCACVTRTADLRRIGPIPESVICGDMFYWTKLAGFGAVGCVSDPLSHYVCYRDGGNGIAGGAQIPAWGFEMDEWARDMLGINRSNSPESPATKVVEAEAAEFVARSTADQFVWKALRGASRRSLLSALPSTLPLLRKGRPTLWIRAAGGALRTSLASEEPSPRGSGSKGAARPA